MQPRKRLLVPSLVAAVATLAGQARAAGAFAGDFGYPFHDGVDGPRSELLSEVEGTVTDVSYTRRDLRESFTSGLGSNLVASIDDSASLYAAHATNFGVRFGLELEASRNRGDDATTLAGSTSASTVPFSRDQRSASALVSVPLGLGWSAAVQAAYIWVTDTLDETDAEIFGTVESSHTSFRFIQPSLTYAGRTVLVSLLYAPQVNLSEGVVEFQSPAELRLLVLWKAGRRGTLVAEATYADWSGLDPTATNQPSLRFGERQRLRGGELGAFLRYTAAYHRTSDDATPDNIAGQGVDLEARLDTPGGGKAGLVLGWLQGSESHDLETQGTVRLQTTSYHAQLAYTQAL